MVPDGSRERAFGQTRLLSYRLLGPPGRRLVILGSLAHSDRFQQFGVIERLRQVEVGAGGKSFGAL